MPGSGNPYLDAIRGGAVRFRDPRPGSVTGLVDRLMGTPTATEFEAARIAERDRQVIAAQAKAEGLAAEEQRTLQALRADFATNVEKSGWNAAHQMLLKDPRFFTIGDGTLKSFKERLDFIRSAEPQPVKPIQVGEGAVLVHPSETDENGQLRTMFRNPRAPDPQPTPLQQQGEAFNKEFAKTASKHVGELLEEGTDARLDQVALDRLNDLGDAAGTGAMAVVRSHLNRFGIAIDERTPPLQAYEALLNRLTPQQRQGLPGAASDRDVAIFRGSLPELWTTPKGRKTIVETLSALNRYKQDRAEVADEFLDGQLTYREFYQKLSRVQDPFAKFRSQQGGPKTDPASAGARNIKDTVVTRRRRLIDPNKDIFEDVE